MSDLELMKRRLAREKAARQQAEAVLEQKALQLYEANEQLNQSNEALKRLNDNLEQEIQLKLAELDRSEQRYRQLIESVGDIIYKISPQGVFTYASPAIETLLGYAPETVVGHHFTRLVDPESWPLLANFYRQMIRDRTERTYHEFPVIDRNDRRVWVGQTVRLIEVDGRVVELVGVARDITARREAQIALQTTEARLSTLIASLHAGVLVEDEQGRIILANQQYCTIFELPVGPDELRGRSHSELVDLARPVLEDADLFAVRLDELLGGNSLIEGEEIYLLNGRILERDYVPIARDGHSTGHLWTYRDVTEKFHARELIRRSEEKYRGIMNNMDLGLLETDLDHVIQRVYERCCIMLGYSEAELVGKNIVDLLLPSEFLSVIDQHQQNRMHGVASSYEIQLIRKDGSRIWVLVSGVPIYDELGELVGTMGIHYDLTQRKKLELELAAARQVAEDARMAEKLFLANMSHEIRTPLNAIIGMSHLMLDTQPNDQQREYIDILKTSADFLHSLISDLLDMTKIEAGRIETNQRPFDLVGLLRSMQKVFETKLTGRPVAIDVMLDSRIQGNIMGDDLILNQILMNLVGNAEKFTEEGSIQIMARIRRDDEHECLIDFTVSDTGIGIPSEKIDTIFQKFKQVNPQGHKHRGTGLGLAITKELVELLGGTITVRSQVGFGSQFLFTLPFLKTSEPLLPTPGTAALQPALPDLPPCHLLVAEDNPMNQKYISTLLAKWMIPYKIAADGAKAVEIARQQVFDLILMDIQMPVMNGYDATRTIRSEPNINQHTPIVALTASAMIDNKHMAVEVGMNDFLSKPFEPAQLLAIIQRYTAGSVGHSTPPTAVAKPQEEPVPGLTLDRERLDSLYGDDDAYAAEMFATFLSDVIPELSQLPDLCETGQLMELARLAHKLRPTLPMVGLTSLEDKLEAVETGVYDEQPVAQIQHYCQSIVTDLDRMIPLLRNELQKRSHVST